MNIRFRKKKILTQIIFAFLAIDFLGFGPSMSFAQPPRLSQITLTLLYALMGIPTVEHPRFQDISTEIDSHFSVDTSVKFKCDLSTLPNRPPIIVHSENHYLKKDVKTKNQLNSGAAKGEFYLGNEGEPFETIPLTNPHSRIFGLEETFSYSLSKAFSDFVIVRSCEVMLRNQVKLVDFSPLIPIMLFFNSFAVDEYRIEAWKNVERPFHSRETEEIAVLIDTFVKDRRTDSEFQASLHNQVERLNKGGKILLLSEIAKALALKMAELARTKYQVIMNVPNLDSYSASLLDPNNVALRGDTIKSIVVDWRNFHFAKHIAYKYCDAAREGKDLRVIVGRTHAEGLIKALRDAGGEDAPPILRAEDDEEL